MNGKDVLNNNYTFLYRDVVYIVKDESQRIKIGQSSDITKRIKDLQIGNPEQLTLVATLKQIVEKVMHIEFEHCRIRGEWFSLYDNKLKNVVQMFSDRYERDCKCFVDMYKEVYGTYPYVDPHNIIRCYH